MSEMLEMWKNELAKLGEKVGAAKKPLIVFSSKPKQEAEEEEEEKVVKEGNKKKSSSVEASYLSEETVCLLMDRFAPL
ncbi:hypothetical protein UlMin_032286 [Ulmus minor]